MLSGTSVVLGMSSVVPQPQVKAAGKYHAKDLDKAYSKANSSHDDEVLTNLLVKCINAAVIIDVRGVVVRPTADCHGFAARVRHLVLHAGLFP